VICDQPRENAAQYLKARHLPTENLRVKDTAEKGQKPPRMASFSSSVIAPAIHEQHRIRIGGGTRLGNARACAECG
jgi:hypothetical protein